MRSDRRVKASIKSPLVIVGCRRSGTTLLRTIFEQHPDLIVHPAEPQFFVELYRKHGFSQMRAVTAIQHVVNHPYKAPTVGPDSFRGVPSQMDLMTLAKLYLGAWTSGEPAGRPVLKDPALTFCLEMADKVFPRCVVINIVRDPRANVSSQRQRWPRFSILACAMHWRKAVQAAASWGQEHPDRYMNISYEALVQYPARIVKELCNALSLPYKDDLLSFEQEELIFEPGDVTRTKRFTAPDPRHLDLWKQRLTDEDIKLIELYCAEEMAFLGYEPVSSGGLSLPLQARRFREITAYRIHEFGAQTKAVLRRLKLLSTFL